MALTTVWDYHNKNDWYQDWCTNFFIKTSVLSVFPDTLSTYINNLIYPKIHQTDMVYAISRFTKDLPNTAKALIITVPYFQNLVKLFACPLFISNFQGRMILFIFILSLLSTSSDLTIYPLLHKRCPKKILSIYHIQYINIFTKLRLVANTRNNYYFHNSENG